MLVSNKETSMFLHGFIFRWKPEATDELKARARREILAFHGVIPGLLQIHVGDNISPRNQGYSFAGIMHFESKEAVDAYFPHPAHLALLEWLVPIIEPIDIDFYPESAPAV